MNDPIKEALNRIRRAASKIARLKKKLDAPSKGCGRCGVELRGNPAIKELIRSREELQ